MNVKYMILAAFELNDFDSLIEGVQTNRTLIWFFKHDITKWKVPHVSNEIPTSVIKMVVFSESSLTRKYSNCYDEKNYAAYYDKNWETHHWAQNQQSNPRWMNKHTLWLSILSLIAFFFKNCLVQIDTSKLYNYEANVHS